MKAKSNILIISDMCGYGKVSAAVQMPILSYMGLDVFNLPTMLISNTFPYGQVCHSGMHFVYRGSLTEVERTGHSF